MKGAIQMDDNRIYGVKLSIDNTSAVPRKYIVKYIHLYFKRERWVYILLYLHSCLFERLLSDRSQFLSSRSSSRKFSSQVKII